MEVTIKHPIPHDEFMRRFGGIAGAGYDEAHAALLRAQGIKPVTVSTTYGGSTETSVEQPQVQQVQAIPATPPADATDLGPLYGLFVNLADMLTETRQRLEASLIAQERVNQAFAPSIDGLAQRVEGIEQFSGELAAAAEKKLNASAAA